MRPWQLLALANFACAALAQTPSTEPSPEEKYRDYTPSQIAALPEAVRLNEVPVRYIFAAQGYEDPAGFELVHSMKLQALMYPAVASFGDAVKAFQRDLGEPATGTLTVSQIAELTYRNGLVKLGRVELPNTVRAVTVEDDYASAQGTWAGIDKAVPLPINQVHIECNREPGFCQESTITVVVPGRDSWEMSYLVLSTTNRYAVTSWQRRSVEATRLVNCRHVDLKIDGDGAVERLLGEPASIEEDCSTGGLPPSALGEPPQPARLIDGGEVIRSQYQALRRQALGVMSSDFQKRLEAWRASAPADGKPGAAASPPE